MFERIVKLTLTMSASHKGISLCPGCPLLLQLSTDDLGKAVENGPGFGTPATHRRDPDEAPGLDLALR